MIRFKLAALFFFLLFSRAVCQKSKADFLLIEKSFNASVLNKYKQPVSEKERRSFAPFAPFKIVRERDFSDDGIREYFMTSYNGDVFYFRKDEKGNLLNRNELGGVIFARGAEELNDSIVIINASGIRVFEGDRKTPLSIAQGDKLTRVLKHNGWYLVSRGNIRDSFFWADLDKGKESIDWEILTEKSENKNRLPKIYERIKSKADEINMLYRKLYSTFNDEAEKDLQAPEWRVEFSGKEIICELFRYSGTQNESVKLMADQIEIVVTGSGVSVRIDSNKIIVK